MEYPNTAKMFLTVFLVKVSIAAAVVHKSHTLHRYISTTSFPEGIFGNWLKMLPLRKDFLQRHLPHLLQIQYIDYPQCIVTGATVIFFILT